MEWFDKYIVCTECRNLPDCQPVFGKVLGITMYGFHKSTSQVYRFTKIIDHMRKINHEVVPLTDAEIKHNIETAIERFLDEYTEIEFDPKEIFLENHKLRSRKVHTVMERVTRKDGGGCYSFQYVDELFRILENWGFQIAEKWLPSPHERGLISICKGQAPAQKG
jgi:hypothetical protein